MTDHGNCTGLTHDQIAGHLAEAAVDAALAVGKRENMDTVTLLTAIGQAAILMMGDLIVMHPEYAAALARGLQCGDSQQHRISDWIERHPLPVEVHDVPATE